MPFALKPLIFYQPSVWNFCRGAKNKIYSNFPTLPYTLNFLGKQNSRYFLSEYSFYSPLVLKWVPSWISPARMHRFHWPAANVTLLQFWVYQCSVVHHSYLSLFTQYTRSFPTTLHSLRRQRQGQLSHPTNVTGHYNRPSDMTPVTAPASGVAPIEAMQLTYPVRKS